MADADATPLRVRGFAAADCGLRSIMAMRGCRVATSRSHGYTASGIGGPECKALNARRCDKCCSWAACGTMHAWAEPRVLQCLYSSDYNNTILKTGSAIRHEQATRCGACTVRCCTARAAQCTQREALAMLVAALKLLRQVLGSLQRHIAVLPSVTGVTRWVSLMLEAGQQVC